jgi:hypothetical protein
MAPMVRLPCARPPASRRRGGSRSSLRVFALLLPLALAACQQQAAPAPEGALILSPAAVAVTPGQQVRFRVTNPPGAAVTWAVQPASMGSIDSNGLFTASLRPTEPGAMATVVATLFSDPARMGLAIVTFPFETPVSMVAASGGVQTVDGVEVESVVQEPVSSVTASDASGATESRSGFYPSGSTSP